LWIWWGEKRWKVEEEYDREREMSREKVAEGTECRVEEGE